MAHAIGSGPTRRFLSSGTARQHAPTPLPSCCTAVKTTTAASCRPTWEMRGASPAAPASPPWLTHTRTRSRPPRSLAVPPSAPCPSSLPLPPSPPSQWSLPRRWWARLVLSLVASSPVCKRCAPTVALLSDADSPVVLQAQWRSVQVQWRSVVLWWAVRLHLHRLLRLAALRLP